MTPPISFDVHSYLFLPYTFPCFCTMFFAYFFFDWITIMSSYLFVLFSLRCTMVSTQRRNLFFFFFFLFFSFFFFFLLHMKAHDFGGGMIFGYGYGCLFYVHGHSSIVTFSGTTLGSLVLVSCHVSCLMSHVSCLTMSQVRSTLLDQICFPSDS